MNRSLFDRFFNTQRAQTHISSHSSKELFGLRTHAGGPGAITGGTGDYKCASGTLEFAVDVPNDTGGLTLDYCRTPKCP